MLPLKTIARRIRIKVHDTDAITYDDEEILDTINCGIRFIRRAIADIRPTLLASSVEGILSPGEKAVSLDIRPTKIVHVTVGTDIIQETETYHSKKIWHNWEKIYANHTPIYSKVVTRTYEEHAIHETEIAHVIGRRSGKMGVPEEFYLTGARDVNFWPIPNGETKYTIIKIDDIEELSLADDSPLNTEFDDFLVEYGVVRLSIGNEYDVSQETQIMSNIYDQVQRILVPPPAGLQTRGYWGDSRQSSRRGGYW